MHRAAEKREARHQQRADGGDEGGDGDWSVGARCVRERGRVLQELACAGEELAGNGCLALRPSLYCAFSPFLHNPPGLGSPQPRNFISLLHSTLSLACPPPSPHAARRRVLPAARRSARHPPPLLSIFCPAALWCPLRPTRVLGAFVLS